MFDLFFKIMKKRSFHSITEYTYEEDAFNNKDKNNFFNFYNEFKTLFGLNKINFNEKNFYHYFEKKLTKFHLMKKRN